METTMAATPKARDASAPASTASPLAFPVPPPPNGYPAMPVFAFPPPIDPHGPTRAQNPRPRHTTVRVPHRKGAGSMGDGLAGLAAMIEGAPLPRLPESAWAIIGRAWFFVAGATMGILLALALVAVTGPRRPAVREVHAVTSQGTARVLVIQRVASAPERGIGALAQNDLDEVAPVVAPAPVAARRPVTVVARRPARTSRGTGPVTKDLLNAGL